MSDDPEDKSPKSTRFQPGQSGNPRGRPSGRKSPADLTTFLAEKIDVQTAGGKRRRITRQRALHEALFRQSLKGDGRASRLLLHKNNHDSKNDIEAALIEEREARARESSHYAFEVRRKIDELAKRSELETNLNNKP